MKKKFCWIPAFMALLCAVLLAGCGGGQKPVPHTELVSRLGALKGKDGASPDAPYTVKIAPVNIKAVGSDINKAVYTAGKYVILDLSACSAPENTIDESFGAIIQDNEYLKGIILPDSLTSIGDYAFEDCSLTSVTIPDSVTSIGDYVFADCSLTSVTIPDSVTSIGDHAFAYCASLTSVTLPNSVTSIGESAFAYCASLTSVTIPDSVTSIGDYAFADCASLTSVTLPNSVISIGEAGFDGDLDYQYQAGGAGTYTRQAEGSTWTKQ